MVDKQVYNGQVRTFKKKWCNENDIIPLILLERLKQYLIEPILDVGAGLGDIANKAYADKETICIDLVLPAEIYHNGNPRHHWVQTDFFRYMPAVQVHTVIISHTQQFLDDNMRKLHEKISDIDPEYIIIVLNENDDVFGKIVSYTITHYPQSNPEVRLQGFPNGYIRKERITFTAQLSCDCMETLAEQIGYLMVNSTEEYQNDIITLLRRHLTTPALNINQSIEVYAKQ